MQVGYVAKPGEAAYKAFPTTGPHLHVGVLKGGQYINPETWRSGLQRLKIGKSRTPLYKQEGSNWMTPYQITSRSGPRKSPAPGGSTDHKGTDYAIAGGEPLFWEGPGTFKPGRGYGTIMTPEGYEVRLLHTGGGKETTVGGQPRAQQIAKAPSQQQTLGGEPITYNIYMRQQKEKQPSSQDFLSNFLVQQLTQQPEQSSLLSQDQIFKALTAATAT
jgi:hypothetical protein